MINNEVKNSTIEIQYDEKTALGISMEMEQELGEIQRQLENQDLTEPEKSDLEKKERQVLLQIEGRAKKLFKEREAQRVPEIDALKERLKAFFNKEGERQKKIQYFINKAEEYLAMAGNAFPQDKAQEIREALVDCDSIDDDRQLINRIVEIFEPVLDFQRNNPQLHERLQRKAFSNGSISGEKFIPIEGTDDIIVYGMGSDRLHLHLAPMKTLSIVEKMKFINKTLPEALRRLAKIIEANHQIKIITATSYIVAANPELFTKRIGFTKIGPMEKEDRLKYFSDDEMPVLRASMTREEFLDRYGK